MKTKARWLLDTNVVSELARQQPNAQVIHWLDKNMDESILSGATVGEIEYGLMRYPAGKKQSQMRSWFERLSEQMGERIIGADLAVWREYGRVRYALERIGRPQEDMDILIAATALTHRLTLVTRNTKHFSDTGCELFNPWGDSPAK